MSRFTTAIGVSLIGATLLAPAGALAAKAGPAAGAAAKAANRALLATGTLTAKDASTATIATPANGTITVKLAPKTRFVSKDAAAKTAGLQVNDQVAVYGNKTTATARVVRFDTVAFALPGRIRLAGKAVLAANGITVTSKAGKTVTVTVGPKTRIRVAGAAATALPATLAANQKVRVVARQYTDGSVVAAAIVFTKSKA